MRLLELGSIFLLDALNVGILPAFGIVLGTIGVEWLMMATPMTATLES